MNLEFRVGTVAHVELSWLAPSKLRRTAIVGSRKMVVYDDTSTEPVRVFDSGASIKDPETFGEYQLTYRTGDIVSPQGRADGAARARARGLLPRGPNGDDARLLRRDRARRRPGHRGGGSLAAQRRATTRVFDESNALARSVE